MCIIYLLVGLVTVILLAFSFLVTAPLLLLFGPLVLLALKIGLGLLLLYLIGRAVVWLLGHRHSTHPHNSGHGQHHGHADRM